MITNKSSYWRPSNEILKAHKKAEIKLSPICCDIIEKYKEQLDWALKKRSSTTLKNMQESLWKPKKDFNISSWNICLLCGVIKIKNSSIWNDRRYKLDIENDIKFLWKNKYLISIKGDKYWLPGVLNNPELNIILEYNPENSSINYKIPDQNKTWTIILNKSNLVNPLTIYKDKVAKTKIHFRAKNKNFELILDFPLNKKNINNNQNNNLKNTA